MWLNLSVCKQNVCYFSLNRDFRSDLYWWHIFVCMSLVYYAVPPTPQPLTFISTQMHLVHGGMGVSSLGNGCNGNGPKSGYCQTSWPKKWCLSYHRYTTLTRDWKRITRANTFLCKKRDSIETMRVSPLPPWVVSNLNASMLAKCFLQSREY